MAGGFTDTLNIRSTDTLLAGGDTSPGRGLDAEEVVLHRSHTGVDQQQAVVILRHQAEGRQPQVSLDLKKSEKALTQVVYACPFHRFSLLYSCKNDVDRKRKSLRPKQWDESCQNQFRGTTQIAPREPGTPSRRPNAPQTPVFFTPELGDGPTPPPTETFQQMAPSLYDGRREFFPSKLFSRFTLQDIV